MRLLTSILFLTSAQSFSPSRTLRNRSHLNAPNGVASKTRLNYVQTDETLGERLKEVQQQWESIKSSGLKKVFINEIMSAEKNVQSAMISAEKAVESTLSAKFSELTPNIDIVNTMKAAEIVADAAATSVKADTLAMNDLAIASKDVVESIKASERAVQSVIDKISAESTVDASDVESLENAANNLMKAMEAARSIAVNVGQSAANDAMSLQKLESVGYGLLKELDYVEKLAETSLKKEAAQAATSALNDGDISIKDSIVDEGNDNDVIDVTVVETSDDANVSETNNDALRDSAESHPEMTTDSPLNSDQTESLGQVDNINMKMTSNQNIVQELENASKNVVDEMQIVENTAKSVANTAQADAKSISSLQTETNDIVDSIRSFETAIEEAAKNPSSDLNDIVKTTGTKTLDLIKIDEENAEMISELVAKDAQLDEIAVDSIQRADKDIDDLVNAAAAMIGEKPPDSSIGSNSEELNGSISESTKMLENVAEHCNNCSEMSANTNPVEQIIGTVINLEPNSPEQLIISLSDTVTVGFDSVPVSELMHAVGTEEIVAALSTFI